MDEFALIVIIGVAMVTAKFRVASMAIPYIAGLAADVVTRPEHAETLAPQESPAQQLN